MNASSCTFSVRAGRPGDGAYVLQFVKELAEYEKLSHEVVATEADFERDLFGPNPVAEILLACEGDVPVGYALFFPNYSTFKGRPGIYLEDLYVQPANRGKGYGKALIVAVARLAVQRECARLEWSVLDWNAPAIAFYRSLGARGLEEWTVQRVDGSGLNAMAALPTCAD